MSEVAAISIDSDLSTSSQLSDRDKAILREVVLAYTITGEPVSSRSVARHSTLGVSPATIRNSMAELEEHGLLSQPHTSAGRMPTAEAYRLYVESLMPPVRVSERERQVIDSALEEAAGSGDPMLSAAGHALSELTRQVSVVLTPRMAETVLQAIDFVPLSRDRALCVVASVGGFVDHKLLEIEDLSREELRRVANYINEQFAGMSLGRIRRRLVELMESERSRVDELLRHSVMLARQALDTGSAQDVVVDGTASALSQPELADVDRVRRLLATFEHKVKLVNLLSRVIEGQGVRVLIDDDSDLTSELGFSLVATSYRAGDRPIGSLGVLGPTRMEYARIVGLVNYLGEKLTEAFEEGARGR